MPSESVSQRSRRRWVRTIDSAISRPCCVRRTERSAPTVIQPSAASRFSVTLIVGALTPTHSAIRPGRTLGSSNWM